MSKISELSDGGVIQGGDTLIAVRSGGNVKVTYGGSTTANIDGGTIDGTVIGGTTAAAITGTTITGTSFVSSGDMTFGDNDKAVFGAGSDLQLYHDGSGSYISDQGVGPLNLLSGGVRLKDTTDTTTMLAANAGGSVTLYHNNVEKLATTATGIDVTGTVTADGLTVDGTVNINNNAFKHTAATPNYNMIESDVTGQNTQIIQSSGLFRIRTVDDSLANAVERLRIDHGTGDISFYEDTGTTAKFFWDSSAESLGLGTTSPSSALDVISGSASIGALTVKNASGSASETPIFEAINGGGNTRLIVRNDGLVGIGTNSPTAQFHIKGSANADMILEAGSTTDANAIYFGDSDGLFRGGFKYDHSADSLGIYANGLATPDVTLDSSGNVGIGTSSPSSKFDVVGGRSTFAANSENFSVYLRYNSSTSGFYIGSPSADAMAFSASSGAERMRIDSSGNVGIGTSSPSTQLNLAGNNNAGTALNILRFTDFDGSASANQPSGKIEFYTNDLTSAGVASYITGVVGSGAGGRLVFGTGLGGSAIERLRIDEDGNVGIGVTTPAAKLEIGGAGEGIILASPDGTRYEITVANGGTLTVTAV